MVQGLGHGHSHHDGICTLHDLNITHQMIAVSRCQPWDGSGSVSQTGRSVSGADLCRLQAHFWGQGERDPITGNSLPQQQHAHGKSDSWKEVLDVSIYLPSSYHPTVCVQPAMHQVCELKYNFC